MQNEQKIFKCIEYDSIWEVEKEAGFLVMIPTVLGTEEIQQITLINEEIVNICYPNGIIYRTAKGTEDISGNYNQFDEINKFDINLYHVITKGYYNRVFLAIWENGTYSYSIYTPYGISCSNLEILINSLCAVDSINNSVNLKNPIVEYSYIFEAEYAVGYNIMIPAALELSKIEHIYVISEKLVEIIYHNDIVYRMAHRMGEDISGIYENYSNIESFDVEHEIGLLHVTAKGNKDLYYVIIWNNKEISGSLYCPHGVSKKSLEIMIKSLRVTNSSKLLVEKQNMDSNLVGGYSKYRAVTAEDLEIFIEAIKDYKGVTFQPMLVATQIVAGINYRFVCNAEAVVLNPISYLAQVTIFKPLPSAKFTDPVVTNIKKLD